MDWECHVGAEHLLGRRNSFKCAGTPTRNLGSQVSNVTHRSGASVTCIGGFLNPDGGDTPWLLLLDPASIFRTTETRAHLPEHLTFAFVASGGASNAQPPDRAISRTWKHVFSSMASRQLAASLLDTAVALNSCALEGSNV